MFLLIFSFYYMGSHAMHCLMTLSGPFRVASLIHPPFRCFSGEYWNVILVPWEDHGDIFSLSWLNVFVYSTHSRVLLVNNAGPRIKSPPEWRLFASHLKLWPCTRILPRIEAFVSIIRSQCKFFISFFFFCLKHNRNFAMIQDI